MDSEENDKKELDQEPDKSQEEDTNFISYKDHINSLLDKVTKGESVFKRHTVEKNPRIEQLEKEGVVKTLSTIFMKESYEEINEEESEDSKQYPGTTYFKVDIPSNFPDVDSLWERILPQLRNIGESRIDPTGSIKIEIGNTGNGKEQLQIDLVRDDSNGDKPGLAMYYLDYDNMEPEEAISILDKVGLNVEKDNIVNESGKVFIHADT